MSQALIDKVSENPNGASFEDLNNALAALDREDGDDESLEDEVKPDEVIGEKKTESPPDPVTELPAEDKTAQGIFAKDGKNILPYGALVAERERAMVAEITARQLEGQNAELQRKFDELSRQISQKPGASSVHSTLSVEQLGELRENLPELADAFESMQAQMLEQQQAIQAATQAATKANQRLEQNQADIEAKVLSDAIASVPKLAFAQSTSDENPEMWNAIAEIDAGLRGMSLYKSLPMAKRFEKAVQLYESEVGEIVVPGAEKTAAKEQPTNPIAKAALAKVTTVPSTLSDLSGGSLPPKSQIEVLAGQNQDQLVSQFRDMSQEKLNQLLNSLPV